MLKSLPRRLRMHIQVKTCSMLISFCRLLLELLDRFGLGIRLEGREAGLCVLIQTRHHVNPLSKDQGTQTFYVKY